MAAIGRFKRATKFYASVVDGEHFRLHGDVFGSPTFDKQEPTFKGVKTLTLPVASKIIAIMASITPTTRANKTAATQGAADVA